MASTKTAQEKRAEHLSTLSFSNLVRDIDEKWSHTYIDVSEEGNDDISEEEFLYEYLPSN